VAHLDELGGLAQGDATAQWANDFADWVVANSDELDNATALAINKAVRALLDDVIASSDQTESINALLAMREDLAANIVGGIPTPEPAGPKRFAVGDTATVTSGGEDWAEIIVGQANEVPRYEGEFGDDVPARGNVYIEAFVRYTALQNGVDYNQFDWQVFAGGLAVDDMTFVSNGPEPALSSGSLPKGRRAEGWLVYEVPAKGEVLLSYGGAFTNDEPIFEVVLRAN